jgi:hypothetical protein
MRAPLGPSARDPLSDVKVMTDPQKNLKLIMKNGVIYKNEL